MYKEFIMKVKELKVEMYGKLMTYTELIKKFGDTIRMTHFELVRKICKTIELLSDN